jgi:hypothetical protein
MGVKSTLTLGTDYTTLWVSPPPRTAHRMGNWYMRGTIGWADRFSTIAVVTCRMGWGPIMESLGAHSAWIETDI